MYRTKKISGCIVEGDAERAVLRSMTGDVLRAIDRREAPDAFAAACEAAETFHLTRCKNNSIVGAWTREKSSTRN